MDTELASHHLMGSKSPGLIVIFCGLATSALALLLAYWLGKLTDGEWELMSVYHARIIPTGAIIVGALAGSGYGLASWLAGVKISGKFLAFILFLQLLVYFGAQYGEYYQLIQQHKGEGEPISFWKYYDFMTRNFCWVTNGGKKGAPLGMWGYGLRALEITGFCVSALIAPAILMSLPYCEKCQIYMKTILLFTLPAMAQPRKIRKKDDAAVKQFEADNKAAEKKLQEEITKIRELVEKNDAAALVEMRDKYQAEAKATAKLASRAVVKIQNCRICGGGELKIFAVDAHGDQIKETLLATLAPDADFIREITRR